MIRKLFSILTPHDKNFLIILIIFSLIVSVVETLAVSIVMPFVSVASNFNLVHSNIYFRNIYDTLGVSSTINFIIIFGLFLFVFYVIRAIINIYYYHTLAKFSEGRYYRISQKLFDIYLHMEFKSFGKINTAHLTKMIINEASYLTQVITALLMMLSEGFIIILIYAILLYVDWQSTLYLSAILVIVVGILLRKITGLVRNKGSERERSQKRVYDMLAVTFGNYRLIKLSGSEKNVLDNFLKTSNSFVETNIVFQTISQVPRLILDTLGFASLSLIISYLVWQHHADISTFMPILSLYILALYRLLPSIHRIITQYNKINFYSKSLDLVFNEFSRKQEELSTEKLDFNNRISLEHVDFGYEGQELALQNISINIEKNESIGIVGESGSGKSTLVDILIGLNLPTAGQIFIDNDILNKENLKSWRKKIGYIPQTIYLFDGTVRENITFGRSYDRNKVKQLLKIVHLWDDLSGKKGIDTKVGENGNLLSGGQKQRIAIARALYADPVVLVLDEATSALNSEMEEQIMSEIYSIAKNMTLIIITHNRKILDQCDKIFEVKNHHVSQILVRNSK